MLPRILGLLCAIVTLWTADPTVRFEPAFPNLKLKKPLDLVWLPGASPRLLVVEQAGTVRCIRGGAEVDEAPLVLDLRELVLAKGNEEGLLALALHPKFAENGRVFVWCCVDNPRRNQLLAFRMDPAGDIIDRGSLQVLLSIDDPASNHNGGTLCFGPDGKLYLSTGDGGKGGDPWDNAQNLGSLLGKVLRLDVDAAEGTLIPADNPFVGRAGAKGEIWAYGLRNVWRMSFDRETGELWGGDVGQNKFEEITLIVKGGNHGWNLREGKSDFKMRAHEGTLVEPVHAYPHELGKSVTGGYVYRGKAIPDLVGWYVFADFQSGRVWALRREGDAARVIDLGQPKHNVSSFGQDPDGELFYTAFDGRIYRLVGG